MTADLVITGGTIVTDSARFRGAIAIKDGAIFAIGDDAAMPEARERLDATGKYILPGAIDAHVHFREPGYTHKETWETGTASAAMGGVTTVFEMPNTKPPTGTVDALNLKLKAAGTAYVDFGIYGLLAEDNLDQLEALIEGGVAAFKCFMGNTFANLPAPPTGAILEGFEIIAKHGYRVALHAENASIMARRQTKLREAGRSDPLAHLAARPAVVAVEAVSRAAILAEWTGARIHILHVSSGDELRPLREAKARGVDITAETCPHYLLLDEHAYTDKGSLIRVNPPVREKAHQDQLWQGVADGTIDMIATDHAPHTATEKHNDDIWCADCGFTGVETQMPLMLTQIQAGRMTLEDYVRMTSTAPARAFGLFPRKGALIPGADADIVVIDLDREETVDSGVLQSKGSSTPFDAAKVKGVPIHTLVRGRFVMRDRALVTEAKGHGLSVRRIQQMKTPTPRNVEQTTAAIIAAKPRGVTTAPTIRVGRLLARPGHDAGQGASAVHLADGRIASIAAIDPAMLNAKEAGTLLMPAPANAHDHGRGLRTLAYGAADAPLEEWLPALGRQPRLDPYADAALAFARMAEGGICAANHCHNTQDGTQLLAEAEGVSRAARDVGIRIAFALPFLDRNPNVYGDLDRLIATLPEEDRAGVIARATAMRALETNMALIEAVGALEHETFKLQYGPVAPQWATHETLAAIAAASAETGRRVHMHLLETERQREWADAHYPGGLIPFLDSIGLLSPRLTVAHAVWLRPDECALLAERGVTVSINLSSNMRLRSGRPALAAIRAAGLAFGIGLDGMSFDDDEDMLRELRLVWHFHARDADPMQASELFDAALRAGRRTIAGDDGGGIVAPGAPADLLALDFAAMTADCVHDDIDPIGILLGRMAARHVRRLVVGGRDIVIDGRCVTVDAPAIEAELTAAARASFAAARPDGVRIERMQDAVRSYYKAGYHRCGPDEPQ